MSFYLLNHRLHFEIIYAKFLNFKSLGVAIGLHLVFTLVKEKNLFAANDQNRRFNRLVDPHIKFLYNMALKYTGNRYDAEDIVQEALFIALENLNSLRDDTKCKSWLFSILRSVFLKELRKNAKKLQFEFDKKEDYLTSLGKAAESVDVQRVLEKKIDEARIQSLLNRLPEKYKSPIFLYFVEDLSYKEIAEYLEVPVGTVMSRLSRAKDFFKKTMLRYIRKECST